MLYNLFYSPHSFQHRKNPEGRISGERLNHSPALYWFTQNQREENSKHAGEVGDDKARHGTLKDKYTEKDTGKEPVYSEKKRSTTRADRLTKEKTRY